MYIPCIGLYILGMYLASFTPRYVDLAVWWPDHVHGLIDSTPIGHIPCFMVIVIIIIVIIAMYHITWLHVITYLTSLS
jgi:hypothetical protein